MKTTSHFIGIELRSELFSNIFVNVYKYIDENNIAKSISFQNPLSPHITLYYLENNIEKINKDEIKEYIKKFDINNSININGFNYFLKGEGNKFVLYFTTKTDLKLNYYKNKLHKKYNRSKIENNNVSFSPHITFLRIHDSKIFEKHRKNIENIIDEEIQKINDLNISTKNMFLYAVNSKFKEEIQIKL